MELEPAETEKEHETKDGESMSLPELGEKTAMCLRDSASASFDRFNELDESVWRSLPFFAAVFGFAATVLAVLSKLMHSVSQLGSRAPAMYPILFMSCYRSAFVRDRMRLV